MSQVLDLNGKRIALGKSASYTSKANTGGGKVHAIDTKATGTWVCINDASNRRYVTVRPSQVEMA